MTPDLTRKLSSHEASLVCDVCVSITSISLYVPDIKNPFSHFYFWWKWKCIGKCLYPPTTKFVRLSSLVQMISTISLGRVCPHFFWGYFISYLISYIFLKISFWPCYVDSGNIISFLCLLVSYTKIMKCIAEANMYRKGQFIGLAQTVTCNILLFWFKWLFWHSLFEAHQFSTLWFSILSNETEVLIAFISEEFVTIYKEIQGTYLQYILAYTNQKTNHRN